MPFVVATIVEGRGEVAALPELLRRIEPGFHYPRPIRIPRASILSQGLERYTQMAAANIAERGGRGAIVIVFDADDDCAATLGPARAQAAAAAFAHDRCYCVVAVREFEAWILAGVPELIRPPPTPRGRETARV